MKSQAEATRDRLRGRRRAGAGAPGVIGVVSGRGGSGVSLVAALLALRSVLASYRTLLVDADRWLDVQRVWLGLPKGPSLQALRRGGTDPEELVTAISGGFEIVSFGSGDVEDRADRPLVRRVPAIFEKREVVVIDAGSRLASVELCIDLRVGTILIVSGADAIGLASTHALTKAIRARSEVLPTVLFNRVTEEAAGAGAEALLAGTSRFLGVEPGLVGHLPDDATLRRQLSDGATLPQSLVESPLTELVGGLMPALPPWQRV